MMKNYLLKLLQQCSEEQFGQDAIEWAIRTGLVRVTYDLEPDVHAVMSQYDAIIDAYRSFLAQPGHTVPNQPAPMQRARPGGRAPAAAAVSSAKKRRAA